MTGFSLSKKKIEVTAILFSFAFNETPLRIFSRLPQCCVLSYTSPHWTGNRPHLSKIGLGTTLSSQVGMYFRTRMKYEITCQCPWFPSKNGYGMWLSAWMGFEHLLYVRYQTHRTETRNSSASAREWFPQQVEVGVMLTSTCCASLHLSVFFSIYFLMTGFSHRKSNLAKKR